MFGDDDDDDLDDWGPPRACHQCGGPVDDDGFMWMCCNEDCPMGRCE